MPKAQVNAQRPLSGLFAVNKPSGVSCMNMLNSLQPLFANSPLFATGENEKFPKRKKGKHKNPIKMGQGGTLDPLAEGVLVIGVNSGTKLLSRFLESSKDYNTIGILGCATDTYDSEGKRTCMMPYDNITPNTILNILDQFSGTIKQMPPMHSALKMDGYALYEYARSGTPLPRPITPRTCTISHIKLLEFFKPDHQNLHKYRYPDKEIDETERENSQKLLKLVKENILQQQQENDQQEKTQEEKEEKEKQDKSALVELDLPMEQNSLLEKGDGHEAPIMTLEMTVSSGTYVRSIVHDIGLVVGSCANVVKLERTRQGHFTLSKPAPTTLDPNDESYHNIVPGQRVGSVIPWQVFENALKEFADSQKKPNNANEKDGEANDDGTSSSAEQPLKEWEQILLAHFEPYEQAAKTTSKE